MSARSAKNDPNLNETLERVFRNIEASAIGADSEDDFKGLFDDLDVNSAKLGPTVAKRNEKLVKLLDAIGDLNLGDFNDHAIDAFGDAYEYLMTMYASSAGKSGGEFFTPQEVSELLARITVVGKTVRQQGLRPGLRLGLAAAEVRQGARQGKRAAGVLRPGDQPHYLQPVRASTCSCTTSTTRSSTSPTATR